MRTTPTVRRIFRTGVGIGTDDTGRRRVCVVQQYIVVVEQYNTVDVMPIYYSDWPEGAAACSDLTKVRIQYIALYFKAYSTVCCTSRHKLRAGQPGM